ncbi:MAG: molybdopterin-dependent oxidoreductase [Coriobacteriales bacterium]|jgi:anaerobic dimethyl sulfoxide reductase subunit A|nr:molybdopterin-dependent oxidoreductase [Coriobacteriales bacterium]
MKQRQTRQQTEPQTRSVPQKQKTKQGLKQNSLLEQSDMSSGFSRRSFVKWTALASSAFALTSGMVACQPNDASSTGNNAGTGGLGDSAQNGVWKTAACMNNCSCGSSRCLLKAYVVDGVPVQLRTDEYTTDTPETPQKRACLRGRAQISNILSADRVKYPMKRKGWSPDNPNGEMRGKDEWERISWDEAIDIIANEMKKIIDKYGTRGILSTGYADIGDTYFDQFECLLNVLGGAFHDDWATVSLGSWPLVEMFMCGGLFDAPDSLAIRQSDLHFYFGCNWQANKGGNTAYQIYNAKQSGGKVIIIDPWLNQTAQGLADEWVPIRPGTDTAFVLGMAYHMITNNLHNQDYLDKYCLGFDADHMPEGAPLDGSFKDYVLGTFDGEPKTTQWAAAICGVPAATIARLAEEVATTEKVDFFAGQSTTKIPAGEMFGQVFYTLALMHGNLGAPGNYASWAGLHDGFGGSYVIAGDSSDGFKKNPANPLKPPQLVTSPNPAEWAKNFKDWDQMEYSEAWESLLAGEYGRDSWPEGKKPVDVHMIYTGGYQNQLNSVPNCNKAIQAWRDVDFILAANPFFCASARYADIVLPIQTWWEKAELAWTNNGDSIYWSDKVIAPLFESRTESELAIMLAKKLGVDPAEVDTMTPAERTYVSLAGAMYATDDKGGYKNLLTITEEDIKALGVSGANVKPQEGLMTVAEFKEAGFYQAQRKVGDAMTHVPYAEYFKDPDANLLGTASGKFEIYSATLAGIVNAYGFSTIAPIGKWQANPEQGQGAQTDEYPLLLWTPHSLRRAHTVNDSVMSLREAFPQECFISTVDAEARGIQNGDIVLMSSPHGKVLRPAKVMPTIVPGAVALQDGAWTNIHEATGIDIGGNPNILQAPKASGQGVQAWTGTICQVEKYTGDIKLEPDKKRALVLPKGIS